MSIKRWIKSGMARSGLAVGDLQALQREVHSVAVQVETDSYLLRDLRDLHVGAASYVGIDLRHEFESIATAHAEAMVYLNRSLREIRAEMVSISATVSRLEAKSVAAKRD